MENVTTTQLISGLGLLIGLLVSVLGYFFKSMMSKFDELIAEVKKLNIDNALHAAEIKYLKEKSREHTEALKKQAIDIERLKIELNHVDHP